MNKFLIAAAILFLFTVFAQFLSVHPVYCLVTGIVGIFMSILGFGKMEEEGLLR